jgi:hypothetical protein
MVRHSRLFATYWLADLAPLLRLFSGHWATRWGFVTQGRRRFTAR